MKIHVRVDRMKSEPDWTLSRFSILDKERGVGVEDEERIEKGQNKVPGETRIPNGIYELDLAESPTFSKSYYMDKDGILNRNKTERFNQPHLLIAVKNVPGFSGILWHWGNTDLNSRGCYIVGTDFATFDERKGVSASRKKYEEIYPEMYKLISENKKQGIKTLVEYREAPLAA